MGQKDNSKELKYKALRQSIPIRQPYSSWEEWQKDSWHYDYTINWQNVIVLKALLDSASKAHASREENEAWQAHHLKALKYIALCIAQNELLLF